MTVENVGNTNKQLSVENTEQTHGERGDNANERLLLFSDGIIAFAITLATLAIKLPAGKAPDDLPNLLADLLPQILTYVIGFGIVSSYWYEHRNIFTLIKRSSMTLVILNLIFLASIVFLPFLAHFYGGNFYLVPDREQQYFFITSFLFYTFQFISGLLILIMWWYASGKHRLLDEGISSQTIRYTTLRLIRVPLAILVYLITLPFLYTNVAYSILPLILFLLIWDFFQRRYRRTRNVQRLRGNTERLLIFSDCVIGIAITLIAAQIELPELKMGTNAAGAISDATAVKLIETLILYVFGFIVVGTHWVSHYRMFRVIKRQDDWLVSLNFAFLLCVTLLFLPTVAAITYLTSFSSRLYYSYQAVIATLRSHLVLRLIQAPPGRCRHHADSNERIQRESYTKSADLRLSHGALLHPSLLHRHTGVLLSLPAAPDSVSDR